MSEAFWVRFPTCILLFWIQTIVPPKPRYLWYLAVIRIKLYLSFLGGLHLINTDLIRRNTITPQNQMIVILLVERNCQYTEAAKNELGRLFACGSRYAACAACSLGERSSIGWGLTGFEDALWWLRQPWAGFCGPSQNWNSGPQSAIKWLGQLDWNPGLMFALAGLCGGSL